MGARFALGFWAAGLLAACAALFAAAGLGVDGGPSAPLRFVFRHAALFIAFFDVFRLAFLLVGVFAFISSWHRLPHFCISAMFLQSFGSWFPLTPHCWGGGQW